MLELWTYAFSLCRDHFCGDLEAALAQGGYLLGDRAFTLSLQLLKPTCGGAAYHQLIIANDQNQRRRIETATDLFNYSHSAMRMSIERCFGRFKQRWKCLTKPMEMSNHKVSRIILALAALENWVYKHSKFSTMREKGYILTDSEVKHLRAGFNRFPLPQFPAHRARLPGARRLSKFSWSPL